MTTDTSLVSFKAISDYVTSLGDLYSEKLRPLKLYCYLINKTTLSHSKAIESHINAFSKFCTINEKFIMNKNSSEITDGKIIYSDKVYIDMSDIFKAVEKEEDSSDILDVIWSHLLTISALVNPESDAKKMLEIQKAKRSVEGGKEGDFMSNIIGKLSEHIGENNSSNPMEMIASVAKSGIFTEIMEGMGKGLQDGNLDIGKLMNSVQGLMGTANNLTPEGSEGSEGGEDAMNMVNSMISNLSTTMNSNDNDNKNDNKNETPNIVISGIAEMIGPMLGALSGGNGMPNISGMLQSESIEDTINAQVQKAKEDGKL